ncbi:MAG: N-acyl-D-aspartate/D-glutamate deacylase [Glaciihabitans sp.]|nr:N-acyl-D-aspartate/D-glutamate deacylase [Glaciihabitans sp.]
MNTVVLRGGLIVDGTGAPEFVGDVVVRGDTIHAIEPAGYSVDGEHEDIDCTGLLVMPGFIDAHTHADGRVFEDRVALALLRQGVTTVIGGQDGVSYAPGDGKYASEYFGALNGPHPSYHGSSVSDLLATYDGTSPINVGYLVPHGTVRHPVMGMENRKATPDELATMVSLVTAALDDGALGFSTGLDYIPGLFADAAELAQLTVPVKAADALYVTHMRGGYETNAGFGIAEVREIVAVSGASVHVSHFHGPQDVVVPLVDEVLRDGIDVSFDSYPYLRGSSLLAMPILPGDLMSSGHEHAIAELSDPAKRRQIADTQRAAIASRADMGPNWPELTLLSYVNAPAYAWAEGMTIRAAADRAGQDPMEFSLELLAASRLEVVGVFEFPTPRPLEQVAAVMRHDAHMVGSDGIYMGSRPHPRGWGAFAKTLATFTRDRGDYTWPAASQHLSANAAARYGLGDRGQLKPGYKADIALVDPVRVQDLADYDDPAVPAVGIDTVLVNGVCVLRDGQLTGATAGRGIKRSAAVRPIAGTRGKKEGDS